MSDLLSDAPPICSICRDTLSADTAKAMPCQHVFDLPCIRLVLEMNGTRGRQCPLCRARIEELHHTFMDDGTFTTQTPGATRPESPLASGSYIRQDEELTDDMTTEQRERILELRRLRRTDDYEDSSEIANSYWSFEGGKKLDTLVMARRVLAIDIEQSEGVTTYELRRSLKIRYFSMNKDWPGMDTRTGAGEESPENIELAKQEISDVFGGVHAPGPWAELQVKQPQYEVECDENGLKAVAKKRLILSHHKFPEFTTSMDIEKVTKITETFLGQLPLSTNANMFPAETLEAKSKVKLAREEIEGADWQGCEYCGEKERNGDCLIPWASLKRRTLPVYIL